MRGLLSILCLVAAVTVQGAETAAPAEPNPEAVIAALDGVVEKRAGGGWIQVKMEGMALTLRFYDEKARAIVPDVDRALVRFVYSVRQPQRRVLIPLGDEKVLTHGQPLRPPHVFKAFISLVRGEGEDAVETFQVDVK